MRFRNSINTFLLFLGFFTGNSIAVFAVSEVDSMAQEIYVDKANQYFKQYNYDTSALYYDSAYLSAQKSGKTDLIAYYLLKKGTALRKARLRDSSYSYLSKSKRLAAQNGFDTIEALSDIELGWFFKYNGLLDSAESYYNHALTIYKSIGDSVGIGLAKHTLSVLYQTYTDYETSLKYALESNRIFKKFDNKGLYAKSLLNLGNIYDDLGEYDTAFSCYEACYSLSTEINEPRLAGKAAFNKGYMYLFWDRYEEAETAFLNAIKFCIQINDYKDLSLLYRNLSIVQKKLKKWSEAIISAVKSLFYAKKADNKEYEFYAVINMGVYYLEIEQYELTEKYYLEAFEMAAKYNFKTGRQIIYRNLSNLYKATQDFEKAYEYHVKFKNISDSITNEEKIYAREKYKAEYELMRYKDQNRIKELEKKKIRFERNLSYGIGAAMVFMLLVFVFFLRMRARKNRIIAAQKIQKLEDEKKLMAAQSVLVGQEKERERIARELHDGIGVLLSTASIHFSSVEAKADKKTSEMLKKANKLLKEAGHEVRQISHNMMPGVLSKFGLKEAIEDLFEEVDDAGEIEVDLDVVCRDDERLPENMEIMIYRIVQEMINNTLKYAKASNIFFHISRCEQEITMEYKDNGIGFNEAELPHGKNLGISGIRSRVEYLGGEIELHAKTGKGTRYLITIPLSEVINDLK